MSDLHIVMKDGSKQDFNDITFFEPRMLEEMTEEGTYEPVGDALYFEREADEIGKGTLIDTNEISEFEYNGEKTVFTVGHATIMTPDKWITEDGSEWKVEIDDNYEMDER